MHHRLSFRAGPRAPMVIVGVAALTLLTACSSTSSTSAPTGTSGASSAAPAGPAGSTAAGSTAAGSTAAGSPAAGSMVAEGSSGATASGAATASPQSSTASVSGAAAPGSPAGYLAKAYAGVVGSPPTSAPAHQSGVDIWIVSCGQQAISCNGPTQGAQDAAKVLGWTTHVCDGQLNPTGWAACIRQGIAAKPAAILPVGLDCPLIQQPLVEADKAGVKTIAAGGLDCTDVGGPKVYSSTVQYLPGVGGAQFWGALGALRADYLIGKTDGKAKVLSLTFTDAVWGPMQTAGFEKELATCGGCSIVKKLDIGNQDIVSGSLATKFSTALLQSPTVNAVSVPLDAWFPSGLARAVVSSGRQASLTVVGTFGEAPNMDLIRNNGGENASAAFPSEQTGWAAVDETIRALAGAPSVPQGIGYQLVDKDHNTPPAGMPYQPPADYQAMYKKSWGVS